MGRLSSVLHLASIFISSKQEKGGFNRLRIRANESGSMIPGGWPHDQSPFSRHSKKDNSISCI